MAGTQSIEQVLDVAQELLVTIVGLVKDGLQVEDAEKLFNKVVGDEAFKVKLAALPEALKHVGEEVKDLGFFETLKLGKKGLDMVHAVVGALKV